MILKILNICKKINNKRTIVAPMLQLTEEVGELATEVNIKLGNVSPSKAGEDGILGEGCDVIISVIDVMYQNNKDITLSDIEKTINLKLQKWQKQKIKASCVGCGSNSTHINLSGYIICNECGNALDYSSGSSSSSPN